VTTVRQTLLPFREDLHYCEKCASNQVRFVFHDGNGWMSRYGCAAVQALGTSFPGEHICLICQRCRFTWAMKTADASDTPAHGRCEEHDNPIIYPSGHCIEGIGCSYESPGQADGAQGASASGTQLPGPSSELPVRDRLRDEENQP
jgi:hypothetical protein